MKLTLLQKQALRTVFFSLLGLSAISLFTFFFLEVNTVNVVLCVIAYAFLLYLIYTYQTKRFILLQLNRVYQSNLFDNEPMLKRDPEDMDFEKFIESLRKFAENKHLEIEKLHNRDDFRRDFLGDVSHELKTPLFTAQGYLLTVLDEAMDDPALKKKYLLRTNKSIERLTYIVKDLDMISKLESGMKLDQTSFNIIKVINEVFDLMELKASKKNIALVFKEHYDFPVIVKADKEKIEQVLINLVSNSIKYGKLEGTTMIGIRSYDDHRVIVEVTDDGMGIEEQNIPRLFERFYRVDKSRSRDQGGSGLGLAIVKHIVEAHDQEVLVKSRIGQGSTFSFTLNKGI